MPSLPDVDRPRNAIVLDLIEHARAWLPSIVPMIGAVVFALGISYAFGAFGPALSEPISTAVDEIREDILGGTGGRTLPRSPAAGSAGVDATQTADPSAAPNSPGATTGGGGGGVGSSGGGTGTGGQTATGGSQDGTDPGTPAAPAQPGAPNATPAPSSGDGAAPQPTPAGATPAPVATPATTPVPIATPTLAPPTPRPATPTPRPVLPTPTPQPAIPECRDGIDNDGDGWVDTGILGLLLGDPQCTGPNDPSESS
jgi:hypothetical protein